MLKEREIHNEKMSFTFAVAMLAKSVRDMQDRGFGDIALMMALKHVYDQVSLSYKAVIEDAIKADDHEWVEWVEQVRQALTELSEDVLEELAKQFGGEEGAEPEADDE